MDLVDANLDDVVSKLIRQLHVDVICQPVDSWSDARITVSARAQTRRELLTKVFERAGWDLWGPPPCGRHDEPRAGIFIGMPRPDLLSFTHFDFSEGVVGDNAHCANPVTLRPRFATPVDVVCRIAEQGKFHIALNESWLTAESVSFDMVDLPAEEALDQGAFYWARWWGSRPAWLLSRDCYLLGWPGVLPEPPGSVLNRVRTSTYALVDKLRPPPAPYRPAPPTLPPKIEARASTNGVGLIDLKAEEAPVREVCMQLARAAGVELIIPLSMLVGNHRVSMNVKGRRWDDALALVLATVDCYGVLAQFEPPDGRIYELLPYIRRNEYSYLLFKRDGESSDARLAIDAGNRPVEQTLLDVARRAGVNLAFRRTDVEDLDIPSMDDVSCIEYLQVVAQVGALDLVYLPQRDCLLLERLDWLR